MVPTSTNLYKTSRQTEHGKSNQRSELVYNALFRGFIEYGTNIYGSSSDSNLDKSNNSYLRKITGCTKTTPLNTLQFISAQIPLKYRRLKIIGRQVVKHCYNRTPVWEQLIQQNTNATGRYALIEEIYQQHG